MCASNIDDSGVMLELSHVVCVCYHEGRGLYKGEYAWCLFISNRPSMRLVFWMVDAVIAKHAYPACAVSHDENSIINRCDNWAAAGGGAVI